MESETRLAACLRVRRLAGKARMKSEVIINGHGVSFGGPLRAYKTLQDYAYSDM